MGIERELKQRAKDIAYGSCNPEEDVFLLLRELAKAESKGQGQNEERWVVRAEDRDSLKSELWPVSFRTLAEAKAGVEAEIARRDDEDEYEGEDRDTVVWDGELMMPKPPVPAYWEVVGVVGTISLTAFFICRVTS